MTPAGTSAQRPSSPPPAAAEELSPLEELAPAEEGETLDVEDVLEPASELGEIEEKAVSAPPVPEDWDMPPPKFERAPEKLAAKEPAPAAVEPIEEAEELPISLDQEEAAEAPVLSVEPVSAELPLLAVDEVAEEAPVLTAEPMSAEVPVLTAEPVSAEVPVLTAEPVSAELPLLAVDEVSEEAPVLSAEPVSADLPLNPFDVVDAALEIPPPAQDETAKAPAPAVKVATAPAHTEAAEPAQEVPAPAKAVPAEGRVMPAEEVVAEAQVAKVGEQVVSAPKAPIDLGELPPVPEEPMQLAATWEFMDMAHTGHAPETPQSTERGFELEPTAVPQIEAVGSTDDEVALAPTWDFVPQWKPEDEAPKAEPSAAAAPAAPEAPIPTIPAPEPVAEPDLTATGKFAISSLEPTTTGKYGIVSKEPEPPLGAEPEDERPEKTGIFGIVRAELEAPAASEPASEAPKKPMAHGSAATDPTLSTARYGLVTGEPVTPGNPGTGLPEQPITGKFGVGTGTPVVSVSVPEGAGQDAGWDHLISAAEPELPDTGTLSPPPPPEADPFAAFEAEEAERTSDEAAPEAKPKDGSGHKP